MMSSSLSELRAEILRLTKEYALKRHSLNLPAYENENAEFIPGESIVPYAGRVFNDDEVVSGVRSVLDFWLTLGIEGDKFEKLFATYLNVRNCLLVNSGSSANLLAISSLTSNKIDVARRLCPGDEVISVAAGFPTTLAPVIQAGLNVVLIDADPITGNARCEQLEEAYVPGKTKAVMMAHALGNPFDLAATLEFCRKYDLWLIEDNCDALGCSYTIPSSSNLQSVYNKDVRNSDGSLTKLTGSWGDLSTQSFYPPHHMTLGEGGAVNIVRQAQLKILVESFRDWGRDCWCPSGQDNTCNKRFEWKLGDLPDGYDHKYIYSHLGYNLKPLDIQAAIGLEQLKKLPRFVESRKSNWQVLRSGLDDLEEFFEFTLPTHATGWNSDGSFSWDDTGCRTECSWFGFTLSVRTSAPFTRTELARHFVDSRIGSRMLLGGNLARQPAFVDLRSAHPERIRFVSDLKGADQIMNQSIFIGTYPGLSNSMLSYVIESIHEFVANRR